MMKTSWIILALAVCLFVMGSSRAVYAGQAKGSSQTVCPVMGGEVDKSQHLDYKGKRIYFCCSSCLEEFKKNPDKYMKKLKEEGVELEDAKPSK